MGLQGNITLVYIEVKREAGFAGDAQQEAMMYYAQDCKKLKVAGTKTLQPAVLITVSTGVMLNVPTVCWHCCSHCTLSGSWHLTAMWLANVCFTLVLLCSSCALALSAVFWLPNPRPCVVLPRVASSSDKRRQNLNPFSLLQVVGPTVKAFGLCLTRSGTILCEPLTAAMDMLLIPHHVDRFAALVSFFRELPMLVSDPSVLWPLCCLTNLLAPVHALLVVCGLDWLLNNSLMAWPF